MSVVPRKTGEKIQFFNAHIAPWTTNAVAIGTTTAAVTDLDTKTQTANDALAAQTAAQSVAKAATIALNNAVAAMDLAGQGIIKNIRTKAETTGNPEIYSLAQIPAPATPTSVGAPGTATDFNVTLQKDGPLELSWKCPNPPGCTGVVYQVWRRVDDETAFTYLGGSGAKTFEDSTIPVGTSEIVYKIQGVRSTAAGPWAQFIVSLSMSGGGTMTASVSESKKIAA